MVKSVSGDVGNFSHRSAWSMRYGTHLHVPRDALRGPYKNRKVTLPLSSVSSYENTY